MFKHNQRLVNITTTRTGRLLKTPKWVYNPLRYQSTQSQVSEISELSNDNLLTGTGAGPFIEIPDFKPIGNNGNLINVRMPQSSNLRIKFGSLVGINGDLNGLTSVNRKLTDSSIYQILQSESSVSLVIGGRLSPNRVNNYYVMEITDKKHQWTIYKHDNLVAWTGYSFELEPTKVLDKWSSFKTNGRGSVLISDGNKLLDIEVQQGESLLVDANNLIACNTDIEFVSIRNDSTVPSFDFGLKWPSLPGIIQRPWNSLKAYVSKKINDMKLNESMDSMKWYWTRTKYHIQNFGLFLKLNLVNRVFSKPIMVQINGPSRLIMGTNATSNNNFTKVEVNKIFSRKML